MFLRKIIRISLVGLMIMSPVLLLAQTYSPVTPVRVYFELSPKEITVGETVKARILIDSEKPINVIQLDISYPSGLLNSPMFNDANSIIQIWQTRDWKNTKDTVLLSGGLPRAFAGTKGEVGQLTFKALKEGDVQISISDAQIYYADGKGTKAEVVKKGTSLRILASDKSGASGIPIETLGENDQSDVLAPVFGLTDTLKNSANGKRIAIFQVSDTGSGLDIVSLRTKKWFSWSEWSIVSNPAELPDGIWTYQLSAKDNAGNSSTLSFYIWTKIFTFLGIVILILTFLIVARYFIMKR